MKNNDMRTLIGKMRGKVVNQTKIVKEKKDFSVRDSLNKMRILNEDIGEKTTDLDKVREEEKFENFFQDLMVDIVFEELEVFDSGIFWGGTIDNQLQWVYKVTPDENNSGFEVNYLETFDKSNPENDEILHRIEKYYELFYKFWRDNILN